MGQRFRGLRTVGVLLVLLAIAGSLGGYALLSSRSQPAGGPQEGQGQAAAGGQVKARLEVDNGLLNGLQVVALGPENSTVTIYLFYDAYCPYCAMEITESYKYLEGLAQQYRVVLADFLVHKAGLGVHATLRCAASQGAPILEVLEWWYSNLLKGRDPGVDGLREELSKTWGVEVGESCLKAEEDAAVNVTAAAWKLGVQGTPTLVVYDSKAEIVLDAVVGYMGPDDLKAFIENALSKASRG